MGTVYIAEQTSPRRKVALKLLRHDLSSDDAFRTRFEHESEAAASTEHPNIVPIYASGEADGTLFIAMRYVDGMTCGNGSRARGGSGRPRRSRSCPRSRPRFDAAHRRGLVHRDVEAGNILLDELGNAYLSDFGLIKRTQVETGPHEDRPVHGLDRVLRS
jgi:serine/threonine protein kinase